MKTFFITLLVGIVQIAYSQSSETLNPQKEQIQGTWVIDLRPSPDSEPYLKEFMIIPEEENNFSGLFYETQFKNGYFNFNWDRTYFAFSTQDMNNRYFHSGYIEADKIYGITFSPERQFTMPWTGSKKPDQ